MSPDTQREYDAIMAEFSGRPDAMALEILRLRYALRQVRQATHPTSKAGQWARTMVRQFPPQERAP